MRSAPQKEKGPLLLDERIKATEVRLIYDDDARVVPREEAMQLSEETGLDLIVVSLESSPPVVKLIDYGKFKYENEKKQREAKKKQHTTTVKEIKMGVRIDENDYQVKVKRAASFLEQNDKVKLTIRLKGREMQHSNLAFDLAKRFVRDLEALEAGVVDGYVRQEGRAFVANLNPKPASGKKSPPKEKDPRPNAEAKNP